MFLFIWLLLFAIVTGFFAERIGIPYLFWDPEYLQQGGYVAFGLLGLAFGWFVVSWNLAMYILHSFRFRFLAALQWPFAVFSVNNFIIPLAFIVTYIISIIRFQSKYQYLNEYHISFNILGFVTGFILTFLISSIYFQLTNQDAVYASRKKRSRPLKKFRNRLVKRRDERFEDLSGEATTFIVDYYFSSWFKIKHTRSVEHYDPEIMESVFKQNHLNALLVFFISIVLVIILGLFIEKPIFLIPAAATIFYTAALLVSIFGMFRFWLGKWSDSVLILMFFLVNFLSQFDYLTYETKAIGLSYKKPYQEYSVAALKEIASDANVEKDRSLTIGILNKWKSKQKSKKPRMIFVCASGGGMKAAMFTQLIMSKADSISNGKLMQNTVVMTGASGGMLSLAYYRELYLRKMLGDNIQLTNPEYVENVSKDLINTTSIAMLTNDVFFPLRSKVIDSTRYRLDRGYYFDKQFYENTDEVMNKTLEDYRKYEEDASIPILFSYPVITNDMRFLHIGSVPMRYMMKPYFKKSERFEIEVDQIDYLSFFEGRHPEKLQLISALRMNATYPWILPNVNMPTKPVISLMDAGARDNFGISAISRFVMVFKDWIEENASGVTIIEIRAEEKENHIDKDEKQSYLSRIMSPVGTFTSNISTLHDYNNDFILEMLDNDMKDKLQVIRFAYEPDKKGEKAVMSFRLTERDRVEIRKSIDRPNNIRAFQQYQKLF